MLKKTLSRAIASTTSYRSGMFGNKPMTLGRILSEAPYTPEELAEREARRRKALAMILRERDEEYGLAS